MTDAGRTAVVVMDGWAGRTERSCEVIGETPTRFRIVARERMKLPRRWLYAGESALVPKTAVRFMTPNAAAHRLSAEGGQSECSALLGEDGK